MGGHKHGAGDDQGKCPGKGGGEYHKNIRGARNITAR